MIIIAAIAFITWGIFGIIFWIPLLVRVVAGFCGSLVYNMIVNNPDNIQRSKDSLDLALTFYARGFNNIRAVLFEKKPSSDQRIKSDLDVTPEFHAASFIAQIIWTIIFWALVISPFINGGIFSLFRHKEYYE